MHLAMQHTRIYKRKIKIEIKKNKIEIEEEDKKREFNLI